jgi:hypothetical protein
VVLLTAAEVRGQRFVAGSCLIMFGLPFLLLSVERWTLNTITSTSTSTSTIRIRIRIRKGWMLDASLSLRERVG